MRRAARTAREQALLDAAARVLPAAVRGVTAGREREIVAAGARGSRLRDVSGNEYVDYLMGSGAILLGHAAEPVTRAVAAALENGSGYLLVNEPAIALAEEVVRAVPCAERASLCSTGSEAVLFAMRLARAYRGRDKILKLEGGFHGMSDWALMSNQWTRTPANLPTAVPSSAGIPAHLAHDVLVAPFNDADRACTLLRARRDELACVVVEPMQRTVTPAPGFLEALRDVTRECDVPLIFDEVVTGFRLAYGGAQARYGVVPDLCALGKSISAGHPLGVVCGRAELMAGVDPAVRTAAGYVAQTGTYSGNPVSATAALAVLGELRRDGFYDRLFATGRCLMEGLRAALGAAGVAAQVIGEPPAFDVSFTSEPVTDFRSWLRGDAALYARFAELLFDRGVLKGHEKFFLSTAHDDEDVELTLTAFHDAAAEVARSSNDAGARGAV